MGARWDTGRLEAFSDAVFAIAITLLVLEISVPESDFEHLWTGIADQWPSYLAYAISFLTIGGLWMLHHGMVRRLAYVNGPVMHLNLMLLMVVAFLPFPTKLLAETINHSGAERAAAIFYGLILFVISAILAGMWRYATAHRELLEPDVSDSEIDALTRRTAPNLGFYAVVIILALLAPEVAAFGYLLIAIVAVLRARGEEDEPRAASRAGP